MSFPNRDAQILAHILEYCNRVEKTLSRFGRDNVDALFERVFQVGIQTAEGK